MNQYFVTITWKWQVCLLVAFTYRIQRKSCICIYGANLHVPETGPFRSQLGVSSQSWLLESPIWETQGLDNWKDITWLSTEAARVEAPEAVTWKKPMAYWLVMKQQNGICIVYNSFVPCIPCTSISLGLIPLIILIFIYCMWCSCMLKMVEHTEILAGRVQKEAYPCFIHIIHGYIQITIPYADMARTVETHALKCIFD